MARWLAISPDSEVLAAHLQSWVKATEVRHGLPSLFSEKDDTSRGINIFP